MAFILKRDGRQRTKRIGHIIGQQRIGTTDVGTRFGGQCPGHPDVDGVFRSFALDIRIGQGLTIPADSNQLRLIQVQVDRHGIQDDRLA